MMGARIEGQAGDLSGFMLVYARQGDVAYDYVLSLLEHAVARSRPLGMAGLNYG